ncbi:STN domain-containing protein [Variovorax sp. UMC13]|jgi:hypothetical protein|uniref:STN domain-containing protein n=1 Tax=Variovorax sp. UMC13 TaxID=1862326 RepID=UPI0016006C17|nr:STN domain-containing protein [Variovorax sp. UMC13]MBB1602021.1 hypothetical protein [Variovorax sp. UMC13]
MNRLRRQTALLHTGAGRCIAAALGCLLATGLSAAHPRDFDVRSGELRPALDAYIAQSGVQLIYKVEDVKDLSTRGIKGRIAPDAALDRLLDGTRLRIRRGPDGAMVLIASPAAKAVAAPAAAGTKP